MRPSFRSVRTPVRRADIRRHVRFALYDFNYIAGKVAAPKFRVEAPIYTRSQSLVANDPPVKGRDATISQSPRPSRESPL